MFKMENRAKLKVSKNFKTLSDLQAILKNPANLTETHLYKRKLLLIFRGFIILDEHLKRNFSKIGVDEIETATKWLRFFVQIQRSSSNKNAFENAFLSRNMPSALTYMIGLFILLPKEQTEALIEFLRLIQQSINSADKLCFIKFEFKGHIAALWSELKKLASFEIQVEMLQLFRLILLRFNTDDFLLSEIFAQSTNNENIKTYLLALKETEYNDDRFRVLCRLILNELNSLQGLKSLVHSFYCEDFIFGNNCSFEKPDYSQLFWFNINTTPRTLTFNGILKSTERIAERKSVHVSLHIKKILRQQNKLKIIYIPPASITDLSTKDLIELENVNEANEATVSLSALEMKNFNEIFKVEEAAPTTDDVYNEKLNLMRNFDMRPTTTIKDANNIIEIAKKPEFKIPSIELYQTALKKKEKEKKNKEAKMWSQQQQESQHHYKTIAGITKRKLHFDDELQKESKTIIKAFSQNAAKKRKEERVNEKEIADLNQKQQNQQKQKALKNILSTPTTLTLTASITASSVHHCTQISPVLEPRTFEYMTAATYNSSQALLKNHPFTQFSSKAEEESLSTQSNNYDNIEVSSKAEECLFPQSNNYYDIEVSSKADEESLFPQSNNYDDIEFSSKAEESLSPQSNNYDDIEFSSKAEESLFPLSNHHGVIDVSSNREKKNSENIFKVPSCRHHRGNQLANSNNKKKIADIIISPTSPNSKNRFFKNPREPKKFSTSSVFDDLKKNSVIKTIDKIGKTVLAVKPLMPRTNVAKIIPNAKNTAERKRKAAPATSTKNPTVPNKKPNLRNSALMDLNRD